MEGHSVEEGAPGTPLPAGEGDRFLEQPRASFLDSNTANSWDEKKAAPIVLALAGLAILAVVVLAVILPVYFKVIKPKQDKQDRAATGSGTRNPASPTGATSGGNGSQIITDTNVTFTYINNFGGNWVYDPNDPFNNDARPNSWTPALNTSWDFENDRIYGVNLGGLFVIEPFITPAFFEKYPTAVDEWTLSEAMAADTSPGGGLSQLEDHYNTFIVEQDIAQIAGAGLNWIRLPIPYWAIEVWPGEPFLAKTSWKYILRILGWARKYGLRVNLDLHTAPGSQNGYNHSGKLGQVDFLNGVMGIANAQRMLNYIRIITEFITQEEYLPVVPVFGIINEPLLTTIGQDQLSAFYLEAHDMIRGITGLGEGHGPFISIHDGFIGVDSWADFLPGSDRIMLDTHPYFAFDGGSNDSPIATGTGTDAGGVWPSQACNAWGPSMNISREDFGVTIAGEFSCGYNDCGLYVEGVNGTTSYGGDCSFWQDSSSWNETVKAGLMEFALASMDANQNWFFWTWQIGNSSASNRVESPLWSYKLGLENGWIPTDPRTATGTCAALGVSNPWNGTFLSWQTGVEDMPFLPTYLPTATVNTLPPPTLTGTTKSISVGDGWFDPSDTMSAPTAIAGCTYPDAWDALNAVIPLTLCGGGATAATATTSPDAGVATLPTTGSTTSVSTGTSTTTSLSTGITTGTSTTTPLPASIATATQ
ncbi:glycoside hydrolase [Gymnopus androsaceus JB14]|uniref:glucan 1,3-beta-glucosidase n=1 Tax=Gymnopus androsaceus JB14 TaxID=1447944 RepID=A0A6A4IC02_9AGAR|nr:glycoside hydrolase [Gymnopus androsaceus JB14]